MFDCHFVTAASAEMSLGTAGTSAHATIVATAYLEVHCESGHNVMAMDPDTSLSFGY